MGADLFVEKTGRYFRDSYNPTNIWWVIGMSYWEVLHDLEDKKLMDDGIVKCDGVKYIVGELEKKPLTDKLIDEHISKYEDVLEKPVDRDDWRRYFERKDRAMRSFWREAAKEQSGVVFSV